MQLSPTVDMRVIKQLAQAGGDQQAASREIAVLEYCCTSIEFHCSPMHSTKPMHGCDFKVFSIKA